MKKWYGLLFFAFLSVLFFQCQKEASFIGGADAGASVAPDPITTSIQGNITDENDLPAVGVAITAGTSTAITDANGYFHIVNAALDKNTTLVTAEKDGYFKGYRVLAATSGCNQVALKLIKKNIVATIASSSGGDATLSNGSKISLPPNGVVMASSNAAYSGDVKVYAAYINPKAGDIAKTVPGSFVANDKNGKRVVLSSYGMLAVELSSSGGEKLQMKTGSVATLSIPIPAASVSSAPATISLWYIDGTTGIWQEEGTATKQGSNYVGQVKHFSYWNCDYPYSAVTLSFVLQTPAGLPLVNAYVEVIPTDSSGGLAHGYTDSLGQVKGLVPANTNLKMEVFGSCGAVAYSQNIPSLNQNTDLGVIKIADSTLLLTFTGTLLNCNNAPVTNGYAIINFNGTTRYVATDSVGRFITTYVACSTFPAFSTVLGVDNNAQKQSEEINVNITAPITNAGTITTCGTSSQQFVNYKIDGTEYKIGAYSSDSLYARTDDLSDTTTINPTGLEGTILIKAKANAVGTFPILDLALRGYGYTDFDKTSTVTFTTFPASVGNFYEGSLNGSFVVYRNTDSALTHNITGTFRVKRDN